MSLVLCSVLIKGARFSTQNDTQLNLKFKQQINYSVYIISASAVSVSHSQLQCGSS